jgi:hypothetical protein
MTARHWLVWPVICLLLGGYGKTIAAATSSGIEAMGAIKIES